MSSLSAVALESNRKFKINFEGGALSSDAGLLLIKEFAGHIGFVKTLKSTFHTHDTAGFRFHTDGDKLLQLIFQIIGAYFEDHCADELTNDPVMTALLEKSILASQPTLSRFIHRYDNDTLNQFAAIHCSMRRTIYSIHKPQLLLLDLDSTLLNTYGHQEGEGFNCHYQAHGYHPLVCYDGMTGDLLKVELRSGTAYSSTGVVPFLRPLLDEFQEDCPDVPLFLRGDSGFATPDLYTQCETNGVSYIIRLKENPVLLQEAADLDCDLMESMKKDSISYAVRYGEFWYRAGSWYRPRRVLCKVEKPAG